MTKKLAGVVSLAALLVLVVGGFYYLSAQMGGGMGRAGGQGGGGNRPPMGMMGGGGGAMVALDKYIYVLAGPTLFKVNPATMKVEGELTLRGKAGPGAVPGRLSSPDDEVN